MVSPVHQNHLLDHVWCQMKALAGYGGQVVSEIMLQLYQWILRLLPHNKNDDFVSDVVLVV